METHISNPSVTLTHMIAIDPERKQKYSQNRCLMSTSLKTWINLKTGREKARRRKTGNKEWEGTGEEEEREKWMEGMEMKRKNFQKLQWGKHSKLLLDTIQYLCYFFLQLKHNFVLWYQPSFHFITSFTIFTRILFISIVPYAFI